jgi:UDP-N-acetylmuramate: L-alanyl-gamma-D-glutamyl-meso-diaminopimelate ligase
LIVTNGAEESLQRVLDKGCWTPVERFNGDQTSYRCEGDDADGSLVLLGGQGEIGRVMWALTGDHNRANACAALLAARHVGVAFDKGLDALSRFQNVKRRMEVRGVVNGVTVYDDFAHHPTAIALTLEGLRRKVGTNTRILAVLEPRSNTMKLGTLKDQLAASLKDADAVFCYSKNLGWDAAGALGSLGSKVLVEDRFDCLLSAIVKAAKAGDQILVMSNGGFNGIHGKLLSELAK